MRAIDDDIRPIHTEKRLSRNLDDETLETSIADAVPKDGARSARGDTLLLVDPTEIRKDFAAYAIADGIRRALTRFGKWVRATAKSVRTGLRASPSRLRGHLQPLRRILPGFADIFDLYDG